MKVCQSCGVEFKTLNFGAQKYCGSIDKKLGCSYAQRLARNRVCNRKIETGRKKLYSRTNYKRHRDTVLAQMKKKYDKLKGKPEGWREKQTCLRCGKSVTSRNGCKKYCGEFEDKTSCVYLHEQDYRRAHNLKYRERYRKLQKQYYIENKERILKYSNQWKRDHWEYCKERSRQWSKNNPIRSRLRSQRRRAARNNADGQCSVDEWNHILELCDNKCVNCGKGGKMTMDHKVPLSRGGSNWPDNLQPLCFSCNTSKHTKTAYAACRLVDRTLTLILGN